MEYMALVLMVGGKLLAIGPFDDVASCEANKPAVIEKVVEAFPDTEPEDFLAISCGSAARA